MSMVRFPAWGQLPEYDNLCAVLLANSSDMLGLPDFWSLEKNEQKIALLVTKATGMTLERWDNLTLPERIPYLEATLESSSVALVVKDEVKEWTAIMSPSEARQGMNKMTQSTWLRRIKDGTLVIERVSTKAVRVRMDCYDKFRKTPK